jgi:hypothetical protein
MRNCGLTGVAVFLLSLLGCSRKADGPVLVYRNNFGGVDLVLNPAPVQIRAGGDFEGDPAAVRFKSGDVLVAVRDHFSGLWSNLWQQGTWKWAGWTKMAPLTTGNPSIAVDSEAQKDVLMAVRDPHGAFWTASVMPADKSGEWQNRHGSFRSDPTLVYAGKGKFLLIGIDEHSAPWSALLRGGGDIEREWKTAGAIVQGQMCGAGGPGMALLAGRDTWNGVGILRISNDGDNQWISTGFVSPYDPSCAAFGDQLVIVAIDDAGRAHLDQCSIGPEPHCGQWKFMSGSSQSTAVSVWDKSYYLFVRTTDNSVIRLSSATGQWSGVVWGSVARGRLVAPSLN